MLKKIEILSDDELLHFLRVLSDYRNGKDISDKEFKKFLNSAMEANTCLDINCVESLLIKEGDRRFGWLVKYLIVRNPINYIKR